MSDVRSVNTAPPNPMWWCGAELVFQIWWFSTYMMIAFRVKYTVMWREESYSRCVNVLCIVILVLRWCVMIYLPVCYTVKDLFWLYGRREYTVAVCACVDAHSHTHTKVSVMTKHLPFRFNIWFLFSSPLCWDYPPQQLFKKMLLCRLKTFSLWSWGQRWRDGGGGVKECHTVPSEVEGERARGKISYMK